MRRFLLRWWAESCVVVPLLTCGCQHSQPCQATCEAPNTVVMGAPLAAPAGAASAEEAPAPTNLPVVSGASTEPPVIPTAARSDVPNPADPMLSQAPPPYAPAAASPTMHQYLPSAPPDSQAALPTDKIRTAADAPHFGHDPSYHQLVGTVDYCRIQQAWLLRYVPVEEEDRYGGCVTLVASDPKIRFKTGQTVRVEGALIDPDSQQLRPAFEVRSMRAE